MTSAYRDAGVVPAGEMASFDAMVRILRKTFEFPARGRPVTEFDLYASVLPLTADLGLAISTDGVGTKLLVAQALGKFDTVGVDCIAMNANDVLCVGAEPIAMVDYVAVESVESDQLEQIALGLHEGARQARISIPGGETAQLKEMLHHDPNGRAFDLVGTCVGVVPMGRIVDGSRVEPGDVVVGFASSGIHSNGLTLARRVFAAAGWSYDRYVPEFQQTVGEELLTPSRIYVELGLELLRSLDVRALAHITSDGFLNLNRVTAQVAFELDYLPEAQPVFQLIQRLGGIEVAEMYEVYNMGAGLCAVVPESGAGAAVEAGRRLGFDAWKLGRAVASAEKTVHLPRYNLMGRRSRFERVSK